AAEARDPGQRGVDVVDAERDMGQPGLVHGPLTVGRITGSVEVEQLQHEPVALQVGRRHAERRVEPQQLARQVVGRMDLAQEREPEQLLVEATRPGDVGHALPDVVEHAHAFAAILNGGHHGGDTLSSMVDGSTGRRSFEAWYTAKHSCSARMAISPVISGCVPSSSPSTNALDM